ncbi:hypothetical protein LXA43DRAFT_1007205 [Ganoderma leucocontextum]|nr:hypothetical protein LXA43DRAFT_1007205 [Ganoderma leucocontextum]
MSPVTNAQERENKGKQRASEVLEVEDEEQRHERMHDLLSRINTSAPSVSSEPPQSFDFGDRSTFPVAPPLGLLSRVQAFLPELAASNADLLRRAKEDPNGVDIENVGDDQAQYIEMNLGLGVFESRGQVPSNIPVADVDLDLDRGGDDVEMDSGSDSDSSSDASHSTSDSESSDGTSDSDSDSDAAPIPSSTTQTRTHGQSPPARAIKPLPARAQGRRQQQQPTGITPNTKPEIVVLSESNDADRSTNP